MTEENRFKIGESNDGRRHLFSIGDEVEIMESYKDSVVDSALIRNNDSRGIIVHTINMMSKVRVGEEILILDNDRLKLVKSAGKESLVQSSTPRESVTQKLETESNELQPSETDSGKSEREFERIIVKIKRNEKWLEERQKQGFFLSDELTIDELPVPEIIKEESDIGRLKGCFVVDLKKSEKSPENEVESSTEIATACKVGDNGGKPDISQGSRDHSSESESDKKLVEKDIETWLNRDCPHGDPNCDLMPECIVELKAVVLGIIQKARASEREKKYQCGVCCQDGILQLCSKCRDRQLKDAKQRGRAELVKEIEIELKELDSQSNDINQAVPWLSCITSCITKVDFDIHVLEEKRKLLERLLKKFKEAV